jgi:hypothetical protein
MPDLTMTIEDAQQRLTAQHDEAAQRLRQVYEQLVSDLDKAAKLRAELPADAGLCEADAIAIITIDNVAPLDDGSLSLNVAGYPFRVPLARKLPAGHFRFTVLVKRR